MINQAIIKYNEYELQSLRKTDIENIRKWRNQQIVILRQNKLLTKKDQEKYYRDVIKPSQNEKKPKLMLFSFLKNNSLIGYGGLTNISWADKRAEVSFLLATERTKNIDQYCADFKAYLTILKKIAFDKLGLNRLFTETYDIRVPHISVLEKSGFILEGKMRKHVKIEDKYIDSLIHGVLREDYV